MIDVTAVSAPSGERGKASVPVEILPHPSAISSHRNQMG